MAVSILQQNEVHASAISLGTQPNDTSVLDLFVAQANVASPVGCATSWSKIATSPDQWRGVGPFTGTNVTLVAGRTPPQVDATLLEIG